MCQFIYIYHDEGITNTKSTVMATGYILYQSCISQTSKCPIKVTTKLLYKLVRQSTPSIHGIVPNYPLISHNKNLQVQASPEEMID